LDDLTRTTSIADLRGEVVILSVWATWRGSCSYALREQGSLVRRYGKRGLRAVALSVDAMRDSTAAREKLKALAPFADGWLDREHVAKATLRYQSVPKSYLIARDGRLIAHVEGVSAGHGDVWNNARGLALIQRALSQR